MTDTELKRRKAICDVAGIDDIGDLSDGFHTFNGLYKQRLILFAALVKAYKDKSWKSYRHENGEYCFGGGWFIVGIDTPEGSYTYHYENKYWDMFDCVDLPRAKHWDGHTEDDAETRLMSLKSQNNWTPCSKELPKEDGDYLVTLEKGFAEDYGSPLVIIMNFEVDSESFGYWYESFDPNTLGSLGSDWREIPVTAWKPLSEPFGGE